MPLYDVTISRTELITFRIDAVSPEEADALALGYGDETASKTTNIETISVEPVPLIPITDDLTDDQRDELLGRAITADLFGPVDIKALNQKGED